MLESDGGDRKRLKEVVTNVLKDEFMRYVVERMEICLGMIWLN